MAIQTIDWALFKLRLPSLTVCDWIMGLASEGCVRILGADRYELEPLGMFDASVAVLTLHPHNVLKPSADGEGGWDPDPSHDHLLKFEMEHLPVELDDHRVILLLSGKKGVLVFYPPECPAPRSSAEYQASKPDAAATRALEILKEVGTVPDTCPDGRDHDWVKSYPAGKRIGAPVLWKCSRCPAQTPLRPSGTPAPQPHEQ